MMEVPFFAEDSDLPWMRDLPLICVGWYSPCFNLVSVQKRMALSSTEFARLVSLIGTFSPCVLRVENESRFLVLVREELHW